MDYNKCVVCDCVHFYNCCCTSPQYKSTFKQWLQLDCRCIKQEYVHTKLNASTVVKGDV